MAVEQASFNTLGGDRTKESFKGKNLSLNEVAEINGINRQMVAWAKAVWDAAATDSGHASPASAGHVLSTISGLLTQSASKPISIKGFLFLE